MEEWTKWEQWRRVEEEEKKRHGGGRIVRWPIRIRMM